MLTKRSDESNLMTKAEIISKTLREMGPFRLRTSRHSARNPTTKKSSSPSLRNGCRRFGQHQDLRGLPAPERGVLRYMPWPLRPLRNERHRSARRREGMGLWPSEAGDLSAKIPERSALKPRSPRKEATQAHIRRGRRDGDDE